VASWNRNPVRAPRRSTPPKQQDLARLYRALRALPGDKRELLVLARFEGLSYDQIGRILGCEAATVKGRVFRAMKELGEIYSDLCKEKASWRVPRPGS